MKRTARAIAAALILATPMSAVATSAVDEFQPSRELSLYAGAIYADSMCHPIIRSQLEMPVEAALVEHSIIKDDEGVVLADKTASERLEAKGVSYSKCRFAMTKFRIAFEEELRSSLSDGWLK